MSAPSMPQYRIRRDDGSELAVPWAAALALLVRRGDIRPDTVIFDAGKGVWSKASESPVVKFIIEDIAWSGQQLPPGWTAEAAGKPGLHAAGPSGDLRGGTAPAVGPTAAAPKTAPVVTGPAPGAPALPASAAPAAPAATTAPAPTTARAAPAAAEFTVSGAPATPHAATGPASTKPAPGTTAPAPRTAPSATAASAATSGGAPPRASAPTPGSDPTPVASASAATSRVVPPAGSPVLARVPAWDSAPDVDTEEVVEGGVVSVEALAPAPPRKALTRNKLIFATSFVGAAAVAVALGFVLRGREPAARSVAAATLPVTVFSPGFTAQKLGGGTFSGSGLSPVGQVPGQWDSSDIEAPAAPLPLPRPEIPMLADSQVASDVAAAGGLVAANAAVDMPPPPTPERRADAPFDVAPQVSNASQVRQALEREYPIGLKETGIGGRVEMTFDLDDQGAVQRFHVEESSGHPSLDQAALRVAEVFEFTPARRRNERVASSISLGITFDSRMSAPVAPLAAGSATRSAAGQPATDAGAQGTTAADQPVATAYDVAPQVRNANQVRQALEREYPIGLRAARIGGRVEVWFYITEQGDVARVQVKQSSGNAALDEAALEVARVFRFEPAQSGGDRIAVWVALGITFQAR